MDVDTDRQQEKQTCAGDQPIASMTALGSTFSTRSSLASNWATGEPEQPPNRQEGFATEDEAHEFHQTVLRGDSRLVVRPVPDRLP